MKTGKTKHAEIGHRMREIPRNQPSASYEWKELVKKLRVSDDEGLRDIGVRELKILQQICPNCLVFRDL
jgi:hypothetical protein